MFRAKIFVWRKISVAELHINTSPAADHRRQMVLQVWLPLIASIVIVLALAILAIVGTVQGSPQIKQWGNISAIYLIIPVLIRALWFWRLIGGIILWAVKTAAKDARLDAQCPDVYAARGC